MSHILSYKNAQRLRDQNTRQTKTFLLLSLGPSTIPHKLKCPYSWWNPLCQYTYTFVHREAEHSISWVSKVNLFKKSEFKSQWCYLLPLYAWGNQHHLPSSSFFICKMGIMRLPWGLSWGEKSINTWMTWGKLWNIVVAHRNDSVV